ncbi:terminase family protein [Frigidibacter sp. SLM-1]|nr:terminase family protein [Frigidibacter sp. ROC022]MCR8723622.1 terminase family protein [Frigidibacter sp. ROC022]
MRATRWNACWIASRPKSERDRFLDSLSDGALLALPHIFGFWAHPHQLPPAGDWRTWIILGGRGAGKTRAGAEWVRSRVEGSRPLDRGLSRRVALVGETFDQAREVMVFGESGILACSPPDRRPEWLATRRMLVWPNGAEAQVYSAHEPEALRGPQFDAAWADELAKWPKAQETWDMLQLTLRLGQVPRAVITTTPRNVAVLKELLDHPAIPVSHAATEANAVGLAASFLDEVRARFAGTRLERQELDGVLLDDVEGALWSSETLERCRLRGPLPAFDRVVVAVDPAAGGGKAGDECGIVVVGAVTAGRPQDWHAVVLEDATVAGLSPLGWAEAALAAFERHGADRLVAEVNQGGDMVEATLRQVAPLVPYRGVTATRGKALRAEPVAALYEQGRVAHLRGLDKLEAQMCRMTVGGYQGQGSPDRVDALVWALTALIVEPSAKFSEAVPRIRRL